MKTITNCFLLITFLKQLHFVLRWWAPCYIVLGGVGYSMPVTRPQPNTVTPQVRVVEKGYLHVSGRSGRDEEKMCKQNRNGTRVVAS